MVLTMEAYGTIGVDFAGLVNSMTATEVPPADSDPTSSNADPAPVDEGQAVQDAADLDAALAELRENSSFASLVRLMKREPSYVPDLNTDASNVGLTEQKGNSYRTTIYLNNYEFRILRATDPANYQRLLKDTILHETVHVFIFKQGGSKVSGREFDHHPSADNSQGTANGYATNYGTLLQYMNDRFPTSSGDLNKYRGMKYGGRFMDINRGAQEFIGKIVP